MERIGVMLDCSRNAVRNVESIKHFMDCLAKMGYNTLELYTEDTYTVEGESYFGYMRGRFTLDEIRQMDAYAKEKGIELIPCIQTLAHFTCIDRAVYNDIIDTDDILLIDEPKTYEFIENIFKSIAACFTSRHINIGMDEAHMVGKGKFFDRFGPADRHEILVRHLHKVAKIAEEYGFTCHMWSDMFFRLASGGEYYDPNAPISEEIKAMIPENVDLCYWDYYHDDKNFYDAMFRAHKQFHCDTWFAGGAWTWHGFAPLSGFSLKTMKPAVESAIEQKIDNILFTMWGDDGAECSAFSHLHTLYTLRRYVDGVFDEAQIAREFFELFGLEYADFVQLDLPNLPDVGVKQELCIGLVKPLLYADPFVGVFDKNIEKEKMPPYGEYAKILRDAGGRTGEYGYIFESLSALCSVLELKADLGVRTRKAYSSGNKDVLANVAKDYLEIIRRLEEFHKAFCYQWHKENKPFGWEIQDARLGGLILRLKTCHNRLTAYLRGDLARIEELEEEILPWSGSEYIHCNSYTSIISRSPM